MSLIQLLINACPSAAVAIAGVVLFVTGKVHSDGEFKRVLAENNFLKKALEDERKASTEASKAATTSNKLIDALVEVATDKKPSGRHHEETPSAISPGVPET